MPYRRLPNTNQARLKALRTAVEMGNILDNTYDLAFSYSTFEDANSILIKYERAMIEYKQCAGNQVSTNKKYQETIKNARLYVSHFIQVLNMCIMRGEMKPEVKSLYGLDVDSYAVPDLVSDDNLYEWGAKVIEGEQKRIQSGGAPIYTPTIGKVRVHYDIFVENYNNQKVLQNNTQRTITNLSILNDQVDKTILDIWNQVEARFSDLPMEQRLERCRSYGVVYYYRRNEKREEQG